jgi:hypothetical protein
MDRNQKKGIISFISGLGVIFLLIGIFTPYYDFGNGLIVAMVFWILSGVLSTFLGVNEESTIYPRKSAQVDYIQESPTYSEPSFEKTPTGALYCTKCGSRIEKNSRFCATCGANIA